MNLERFGVDDHEHPEDEEKLFYAPTGDVRPLVRQALRFYEKNPHTKTRVFVEIAGFRCEVDRDDTEDGAVEKYKKLLEIRNKGN